MEIKRSIYPNCSEWDQELYSDEIRAARDKEDLTIEEEIKEELVGIKDWD